MPVISDTITLTMGDASTRDYEPRFDSEFEKKNKSAQSQKTRKHNLAAGDGNSLLFLEQSETSKGISGHRAILRDKFTEGVAEGQMEMINANVTHVMDNPSAKARAKNLLIAFGNLIVNNPDFVDAWLDGSV